MVFNLDEHLKYFRDNLRAIKKGAKDKGYKVDFDRIIKLDKRRTKIKKRIEELRRIKNIISNSMKK